MSAVVRWFVTSVTFFSFFILCLLPWKIQFDPLCCWYFNFNPYSFDFWFIFCFWPFCRSFIYFQFRYSILIFHILFLQYGLYFFYLLLNYYFFFGKITLSILSSTPFYTLPRCFEKYRNHVNFISVHNILYNIKKINKKYWIIYRFVIVFNWMI